MSNPYRIPSWRRNPFHCCMRAASDRDGHASNEASYQEAINSISVKEYLENHPRSLFEVIRGLGTLNGDSKQSPDSSDECTTGCRGQNTRSTHQKYPLLSLKVTTEILLKEAKGPDATRILYNAAGILASILRVDWFSLYLPSDNNTQLCEYEGDGQKKHYGPIGKGMTVSAEAAFLGVTLLVDNLPQNAKYPNGIGHPERAVHSVLSIPLILPCGQFLGVIEQCKDGLKEPFGEHDLQIANSYLGWMLASLHQSKITKLIHLQSKLNDFLLDSTKKIFDDMISIDTLVENILLFTKELVNADRCAMFLVDEESDQLYAHYFDEGSEVDGKPVFSKNQHIRFSCDKGIAGHVYQTGEAVNIADAYGDARFNPEVDQQTGYRTKNILCMPVISKSRVIGVLQMINSLSNDHFTPGDEDAFKTYAVYCALALHCSRLYSQLEKSKAHHKVAVELCKVHMPYPDSEPRKLFENTPANIIPDIFFEYDFNSYQFENELPQLFIYMLHDLFGKATFNFTPLSRFILTVRKNYRTIPYHNWFHAMNVAHSLYVMIKKNPNIFSTPETMALVVAGICHDLDHRGYNNIYFKEFNHPLSVLYKSSIMEEHHFKMTVTILELEGHDIFSFLSPSENKKMLVMMHDAIIATDLNNVFGNRKCMVNMLESKSFDLHKEDSKKICKALMMTAADLCAIAKPFVVQQPTVMNMYLEFYKQGDEEKAEGLPLASLMNRELEYEIPKQEVGFINIICVPLFSTLSDVLPGVKPLLEGTYRSRDVWQKISDDKNL